MGSPPELLSTRSAFQHTVKFMVSFYTPQGEGG